MDNISYKVKEAFNHSLPCDSTLSEFEKQKIRRRIASLQSDKTKRKLDLFPKLLTVLVAAGFIFFLGEMIEKESQIGNNPVKSYNMSPSNQIKQNADAPFPQLKIGEEVNGWVLNNQDVKNGQQHAYFDGTAIIKGNLFFSDSANPLYPNKIIFVPDENTIKSLPVKQGVVQKLLLDFQNQASVGKYLDINPGEEKQNVTIKIDSYTENIIEGLEIPDTVHFVNLDQSKKIAEGTRLKTDTLGHILLPNRLQRIYETYSKTYEDEALANLSPLDIFTIYFYAEEQKDYKTQYALYIKDPEVYHAFETYEQFDAAVKHPAEQVSEKKFLERVKLASLHEVIQNKSQAIIVLSKDGAGFGLTKNKKGIWKVNWMPIQ